MLRRGRGVPAGSSPPPPLLKGAEPRRGGSRCPPVPRLRGNRSHGRSRPWQHGLGSWRCPRPRALLSLRPVNVLGRRAPGMRAPRNTNQFLMREKYQLMHLRSDSLGTESGGSDCDMDPLDMDSYLGLMENARGALLECAGMAVTGGPGPAAPRRSPTLPQPEESQQYFPSEHDVMESESFMERDFDQFCSSIA